MHRNTWEKSMLQRAKGHDQDRFAFFDDILDPVSHCATLLGSAKELSLGCVKRAPAPRGGQDAGITADPCIR